MTKLVAKRFTIYRNGDVNFRPVQWTYSNRYHKTFKKICEELQEKVPVRKSPYGQGGIGVKLLYSENGVVRIETIEQLERYNGDKLVVAGPEAFKPVKGGYDNIGPHSPGVLKRDVQSSDENYTERNKRTPKQYIWRSKQVPTWEKLLEDLGRIAPPIQGGDIRALYTLDGKTQVEDFEELQHGGHYVAADGCFQAVHGGYFRGERQYSENPDKRDELFFNKEVDILKRHKQKLGMRKNEDRLLNRKDQINPENLVLFIFRNGAGLESQRFIFTLKQLDRGMPWIMEDMAKKFKINPERLVTTEGKRIATVGELVNYGAYIIVPFGENFRDTWYFLPEGANPTNDDGSSENGERSPSHQSRSTSLDSRRHTYIKDTRTDRSSGRSEDSRSESERDYRFNDNDGDEYARQHRQIHESRHHTPRESPTASYSKKNSWRNHRSLQSSPNLARGRYTRKQRSAKSDSSNQRSLTNSVNKKQRPKQSNRLSVNGYRRDSSIRSGDSSSTGGVPEQLKRSLSDRSGSFGRNRSNASSATHQSPVNYDLDSSGLYRASTGHPETQGAETVKDSRKTKTEVPLDQQIAIEVPV